MCTGFCTVPPSSVFDPHEQQWESPVAGQSAADWQSCTV
jgi:hypothetical protein